MGFKDSCASVVEGIGIKVLVGDGQSLLILIPETFMPPQMYGFPRASIEIRLG